MCTFVTVGTAVVSVVVVVAVGTAVVSVVAVVVVGTAVVRVVVVVAAVGVGVVAVATLVVPLTEQPASMEYIQTGGGYIVTVPGKTIKDLHLWVNVTICGASTKIMIYKKHERKLGYIRVKLG